jgi:hypothetical protein
MLRFFALKDPKMSTTASLDAPSLLLNVDLTPGAAAQRVASNRAGRRHVSPQAIVRWATLGTKLRNGERLKLKAVRSPGGWLTREDWLQEFLDTLTADRSGLTAPPCAPARAAAAKERLKTKGFFTGNRSQGGDRT